MVMRLCARRMASGADPDTTQAGRQAKDMTKTQEHPAREAVAGVILAGGLARRMGGEPKALIRLGGRMLIEHVIERLSPQVDHVLINANADHETLKRLGYPVLEDVLPGHAGPLAGVLTGMRWAAQQAPQARWLVSVAVDTPFFPHDLVARLLAAAETSKARIVRACSGGRAHPVFALWDIALAEDLEKAMRDDAMRKIDRYTARHAMAEVTWPDAPFDPFFNINRPDDLKQAAHILTAQDS